MEKKQLYQQVSFSRQNMEIISAVPPQMWTLFSNLKTVSSIILRVNV